MRSTISLPSRDRAIAAFSLIEIVLAVGVISFALVAILGLFPVALQTATNSQRETQAALIARSIFSDLEAQSGEKRFLLKGQDDTSMADAASGTESKRYKDKIDVDLATPQSYYLAFGDDGTPLDDKINADDYSSGFPKAGYLAQVTVATSTTPPLPAGLSQLEVTVGAPGIAPEKKRTSYPFVSLLNNGKTTP